MVVFHLFQKLLKMILLNKYNLLYNLNRKEVDWPSLESNQLPRQEVGKMRPPSLMGQRAKVTRVKVVKRPKNFLVLCLKNRLMRRQNWRMTLRRMRLKT